MPNLYATLTEVKNELGETTTDATRDAILLAFIEDMSRNVDAVCERHFYVRNATKYIDVIDPCRVIIDDCLSLSALNGDSEGDGSFDGTTYTEGDLYDFVLWPDDSWPKMMITPSISPDNAFSCRKRFLKAVGIWGYGDGESATPYRSTGLTGTVADASATTLTASADASATIYPGNTLLVESEQMFVSAVSTTSLTVERGVNGTTAAAHAAKSVSVYRYPREISKWVRDKVKEEYLHRDSGDVQMEMIGQYQIQRRGANVAQFINDSLLSKYQRLTAA